MKRGVVYSANSRSTSGEVEIGKIIGFLKNAARVMAWGGLGLVGMAVINLAFILLPVGWAELRYGVSNILVVKQFRKVQIENKGSAIVTVQVPEVAPKPTPVEERPTWAVPDVGYSVYIPKLEAVSPVISNVDPGNEKEYSAALKKGVAEASGLAHPGQVGTTYLFAHSVGSRADFARYNAVFYLLDKLTEGDRVELVYQNKLYKYRVDRREILSANDIKYLLPQENEEILVLQTCFPPGTTWKRLMVVAKPI